MRKKGQMRGGRKQEDRNKAGYTAQDAPSTLLKITRDGRTEGRTDTTSYRDGKKDGRRDSK